MPARLDKGDLPEREVFGVTYLVCIWKLATSLWICRHVVVKKLGDMATATP